MKSTFLGRLAAVVAVITLVGPFAFAAQNAGSSTVKRTVTIKYDATIDGQKIAPGDYEFEVSGDAEPVLVIKRKKQDVARVNVERHSIATELPHDQVRYRTADGAREIVGVTFRGSKDSFVINGANGLARTVNP